MGYIGPIQGYTKDWYRNGKLIARYVRDLADGECPCGIEKEEGIFIDGVRVYRKI